MADLGQRPQPVSQSFQEALTHQQDAIKRNREGMDTSMREKANMLRERLGSDSTTVLAMCWAEERGTSTWLTALPLVSQGFDQTWREFYDAPCLRYGWEPSNMPTTCACGQRFSLEHALTCRRGRYIAMRHDEVRDLFAALLSETCHKVATEPELQLLNGAPLHTRGTNLTDDARLDIKGPEDSGSQSVWGNIFWWEGVQPLCCLLPTVPSTEDFRQTRSAKAQALQGTNQRSRGRKLYAFGVFKYRRNRTNLRGVSKETNFPPVGKRNASYSETMGWLWCRISSGFCGPTSSVFVEREPGSTDGIILPPCCPVRGQGAVLVSMEETRDFQWYIETIWKQGHKLFTNHFILWLYFIL